MRREEERSWGELNPDDIIGMSRYPGGAEIPLFPLNLVLFPGMPLPLQIFEPRYHQMMKRCLAGNRIFGVALITEGDEAGGIAQVWPVGTTARIEDVEALPDGRLAVLSRGLERFRILERLPDDPYPRAVVSMLPEEVDEPGGVLVQEVQDLLLSYLLVLGQRQGTDWGELSLPEDPVLLGYVVGAVLPCTLDDKQRLLQASTPFARLMEELPMLRAAIAWEEGQGGETEESAMAVPFKPRIDISPN